VFPKSVQILTARVDGKPAVPRILSINADSTPMICLM